MQEKIIISGPEFSNFVRSVALCCTEKGIEYELTPPTDESMLISPFKKVPVFKAGEVVIYETAAICRYIDRAYDGVSLMPHDSDLLAWMDQWVSAALCYFDSAIIRRYVLEFVFPKGDRKTVRKDVLEVAEQEIKKYLDIMSEALQRYDYFSGQTAGIADYIIVPMLDHLDNGVVHSTLLDKFPQVQQYLNRMYQRPSCQKILGNPLLGD